MRPVCLLMIFSTFCTTLPHNLIKDKLIDLIERIFQRDCLHVMTEMHFLLWKTLKISFMVMSKCM